jgi:O-antigen/teichoic acid export membrane protein
MVVGRPAQSEKFERRELFRFAAPVAYLVMLDMVVWQRSETFFLKSYSLWQEIGFYSVAYVIVSKLNEALVAATSTLLPLQSSRFAVLRALQMTMVPVCMLSALWAKPAIRLLYGAGYVRVFPVLLLLLLSPLAVSFTDVSVASLYALDRQKSLVVPLTFTAALNIALAFMLVPRWGAVGAAAANSAAQVAEGSFLLLFSASVLEVRMPWRSLFTIYVAGVISFLPAGAAYLAHWPVAVIAMLSVAACLVYLVLLLWTREFAPAAWRSLRMKTVALEAHSNA